MIFFCQCRINHVQKSFTLTKNIDQSGRIAVFFFTQHQTIRHSTPAAPRKNWYAAAGKLNLKYLGTLETLDTFGRVR